MDPAHTAIGSKYLTDVLDFVPEAEDTPPRQGIVACALYRDGRRVRDIVDLRERLTAAFEASLLLSAARQNDIVKKLGSWAAILAVPTAVAGIYGMNFKYMNTCRSWSGPSAIQGHCSLCWQFVELSTIVSEGQLGSSVSLDRA